MTDQTPAPQTPTERPQTDHSSEMGGNDLQALLAELTRRQAAEPLPAELPLKVPVPAIKRYDALFQPRGGKEDEAHLSELGDVLRRDREADFDPLTVLQIGREMILVDGHHRLTAYQRHRVQRCVPVEYFDGSVADALLLAGMVNRKAKLVMNATQRSNYAWKLVNLGGFSKAQIAEASGLSDRQVGYMRSVARQLLKLGDDPAAYADWWKASQTAQGKDVSMPEMDDAAREEWLDDRAADYAKRMAKEFGDKLSGNPEMAARAFAKYFGRNLIRLYQELPGFMDEQQQAEIEAETEEF